jgi:hypothetical protein
MQQFANSRMIFSFSDMQSSGSACNFVLPRVSGEFGAGPSGKSNYSEKICNNTGPVNLIDLST